VPRLHRLPQSPISAQCKMLIHSAILLITWPLVVCSNTAQANCMAPTASPVIVGNCVPQTASQVIPEAFISFAIGFSHFPDYAGKIYKYPAFDPDKAKAALQKTCPCRTPFQTICSITLGISPAPNPIFGKAATPKTCHCITRLYRPL
jgi:hypothetical protein